MDIDNVLVDEFISEANDHLRTIEDDFLELERQRNDPDPELVDKIFRAVHSVKGGAAFLGLPRIKELAHAMENLLAHMRSGERTPDSLCIDLLLRGVDKLNTMIAAPTASEDVDCSEILAQLKELLAEKKPRTEAGTAAFFVRPQPPSPAAPPAHEPQKQEGAHDTRAVQPAAHQAAQWFAPSAPPPGSVLLPDDYMKGVVAAAHDHIYHVRLELDAPDAPSYADILDGLARGGDLLAALLTAPEHDITRELPPNGLAAEFLLCSRYAPEEAEQALDLPSARCTLVRSRRMEKTEDRSGRPAPRRESPPHAHGDPMRSTPQDMDAPPAAPVPDKTKVPARTAKKGAERGSTIRINVDILDKLMTLAGELVLVRNQQLMSMDRSDAFSRNIVQRLDVVTSELQETIMQTRMQPIGNIFNKLPRIVRDLSQTLGKKIELVTQGSEVELDKTILESLNDPLLHIIRNSCDHGIEPPEEREKAGKNPKGVIRLRAYHEGGQINLEISDDGKGIGIDAVRQQILERRLRTDHDLAQLSDKEVLSLITLPGFSTAQKVSDISGRGVGMDVVRHAIDELGGNLELETWPGQGTSLHLRLPLTLAIIPCLIVTVAGHRFAIPQVNLEELVCLYDDDVRTQIEVAGNQEVYRLRNRLLPMVRLNEILARPTPFTRKTKAHIAGRHHRQGADAAPEDQSPGGSGSDPAFTVLSQSQSPHAVADSLSFAVVKVGAERFGLIVDKVIGTEEIVVKPMHSSLKSLQCYSGATVMGDGSVALILDIEGIARHAGVFLEQPEETFISKKGTGVSDEDTQSILIFRNGPQEQFALALPLIRRIEKIAMRDVETVGQKEFITIDKQSTLVIRLDRLLSVSPCDPKEEMFLILPKFIKRSFGLLMSQIIDIVETPIRLNTESYVEEGLLGTDVILGHLTLFPDLYRLIELAEPQWFAERRQALPPPTDKKRILLVEDSSFLRHMLRRYLSTDGYEIWDTEHGKQALELMEHQDFDLVVSDIEMPVMDGMEFIKKLRYSGRQKDIPAMALTSLNTEEDKRRALAAGFNKYQVKIDRERFLADCAKLLTTSSPQRN